MREKPSREHRSGAFARTTIRFLGVLVSGWMAAGAGLAATHELSPADNINTVEATIQSLGPGDEVVLRGGLYTLGGRFSFNLTGTELQPIVIRAKDGERPHFHRPNQSQNIIDVDYAAYVTMRGIEFSGGSAGIRISGASHLTIEDCEIHDTGDVALRANDSGAFYDNLRILRNHIHHTNNTGEGMYLGCNYDGCQVANSLIAGNYVHHTNQASVVQGDGIELKEGSYNNIIVDNVIHDTNYPCILTYGTVGNGASNIIERNVLWNCGDHAIQSAADATIRNNIILSANSDGIAMQPHQNGAPANLEVVHNTIFKTSNDAVSVSNMQGSVLIANNAFYTQGARAAIYVLDGDQSRLEIVGNVGTGVVSGTFATLTAGDLATDFVQAHYNGAPPMDAFPAAGGALPAAGEASYVTADDFNGTARAGVADAGAYAFSAGGNPGWPLSEGFKSSGDDQPVRADYNGDGVSDVLVRNNDSLSYLEVGSSATFVGGLESAWVVKAVGNFDGGKLSRILLRNGNALTYLRADGSVSFVGGLDARWIVQGSGDLDGDGAAEIPVRNGNLLSYLRADGDVSFIGGLDPVWFVQGVGDLDGDGADEILVRNGNWLSYVEVDGSVTFVSGLDPAWAVQVLGDLDGDGAAETVIRNGSHLAYLKTDGGVTYIGGLDPVWAVEEAGDYDGDGVTELLVRSGAALSYLEPDGRARYVGTLDPSWTVQPE